MPWLLVEINNRASYAWKQSSQVDVNVDASMQMQRVADSRIAIRSLQDRAG